MYMSLHKQFASSMLNGTTGSGFATMDGGGWFGDAAKSLWGKVKDTFTNFVRPILGDVARDTGKAALGSLKTAAREAIERYTGDSTKPGAPTPTQIAQAVATTPVQKAAILSQSGGPRRVLVGSSRYRR
jgi:hypothetical protein